jgi:cytoskeletal protein RodZ
MSLILLLSGIIFPLLVFFIGQAVFLYYGDRIKTWTAQRSVEKMVRRVEQLKKDVEEAREMSHNTTPQAYVSLVLMFTLCAFLPSAVMSIFLVLILLAGNLNEETLTNLDSVSKWFYLTSNILMLIGLSWLSFIWWRVFYTKAFRNLTRLLANSVYFNKFEAETTQAIKHLEGRIKRMEK